MSKVMAIAAREYRAIVGTKAFLIAIILMPILMGGGIAAQVFLKDRVGPAESKIVVIDETGKIFEKLAGYADEHNKEIINNSKNAGTRYVIEAGPDGPITDEDRCALSDRIRKGELTAFVEIPKGIEKLPSKAQMENIKFYAENAAVSNVRDWMQGVIGNIVREQRLKEAKIDLDIVNRANSFVYVVPMGLVAKSQKGEYSKPQKGNVETTIFLPFGMMMLMFLVVFMAAQPMLESVLEEKSQRIAEVLLGSASAFQLMLGKLIGGVCGSLTVVVVYGIGGGSLAWYYDKLSLVPMWIVPWFIVYQVLAVMLFGSIFMAVGAAVNQLKEAQSMLMPIWLLLMFPLFVWLQVVQNPMSNFATWLSFIPPGTSLMMVLRMASSSSVPVWQSLLGIVIMLAATLVCIFATARIFRIGILAQGKTPKMTELIRWAIRG